MYKVIKRDCPMFGIGPYVCEFICDTASDVTMLPTSTSEGTGGKSAYDNQKCASGSIATIADNGSGSKWYMLNNQDVWCPYSVAAGSSGGSSSGSSITVDSALSETSTNPAQNKVITAALNEKADTTHTHTANEVGADASGSAASALVEAKAYTDSEIADLINGAPTTRDTLKEISDAMDENQTVVEALDAAIGTKANKTDIPTKVSQLENDSGYLTEHQDLSVYAKTADIPTKVSQLENDSGYLTEHQDLSEYAKTADIPTELPANGGNANTVNGHSVETDVPADAVFTDTVPDLSLYALKSKYGDTTINVGRKANTTVGEYSTAEGNNTTASGSASHAEGGRFDENDWPVTISDVEYIISGSTAYGTNSHAEGTQTFAYGDFSHAEGFFTIASGYRSHAEGFMTTASGGDSHAEGHNTTASGSSSHAEGYMTTASGVSSHAEGSKLDSNGVGELPNRTVTISNVDYAISGSTAYGINSHAEGTQSFAYGYSSHAEGKNTTASGICSHAEGENTTASGENSHAEGFNTTASDICSHAEGCETTASSQCSHAEGDNTTASGICSHAEGCGTTASGESSHAEGFNTTASNDSSHACGHYNVAMTDGGGITNTTGTAFVIGNGMLAPTTGNLTKSNAFSVMYDGTVKAKSTITASTTADYAEFFEWLDGNPDSEDRVGYFVTMDGDKIRIANADDDYILGVVSGEPFVLGNGDCDTWNGMFLRDEFRRTIYEPAPKIERILDDEGNPTGEFKEIEGEFEGTRPKLNPEYDHTKTYISRFDRPEWSPVGMLGVLAVRHDGSAKVNGYVTIADGGIATACDKNTENSYRVIKANSDTVVEIIFR